MRLRYIVTLCLTGAVLAAILVAGCAVHGPPDLPVCPGKANVHEALAALAAHADSAVSFRANGQFLLTYHPPDSDREKRHNLPMQLWFDPPSEIYIQGSIAVDPKAVVIGSNDRRFWLALRPKEMSSYYTGRWEDVEDVEGLMMSPKVVLEAFGIVAARDGANAQAWSLQNKGPFDILTKRDETGRPATRVHVYACDYLVRKIEYFDGSGTIVAVAELGEYEPVAGGFRVPTRITVTAMGPANRRDSIDITVTSTRVMEFSERLRDVIFNPPRDLGRFEQVYVYRDGGWIAE